MIEAYAAGVRALAVLASAYLLGTPLFLLLAGAAPAALAGWDARLCRSLPIAALVLVAALAAMLQAQALGVGGETGSVRLSVALARETAYGHWWSARAALALLALVLSILAAFASIRLRTVVLLAMTVVVTLTIGLAPMTGHAAGTDDPRLLVATHIVHLLALCAWLGGLPAWIGLARRAVSDEADIRTYAAAALGRFSLQAIACMAVIVITGGVLAWQFIGDAGDLLGTRYGLLLCAKIALLGGVLVVARRVRQRVLPGFASPGTFAIGAALVHGEAALAVGVLALGAGLAQTIPAIHDQPRWWLPVRLSLDAGWDDPDSRIAILLGAALAVFGGIAAVLLRRSRAARVALAATGVAGLAIAAWGLSVAAYPDTYLRPPVPYLSLSIDQGRSAFEVHCTSCHGAGGLGDGPLARTLRKPPANLSEPHTALHTPGDMFWWFTHGMPEGPMPGFAEVLDEEQRWDLVNFLRTFSQGFQARVIGPRIVPGKPWLGAPDFYYAGGDGAASAQLKDLRGVRAALIVFTAPDDPRSQPRLDALRQAGDPHFAVIAPQTEDVWNAYQFLTRTLVDRGAPDRLGMPLRHVEFLVDRFGYVRARWVPSDEPEPWTSTFDAAGQVAELAKEGQILPPPDLHLH